MTDGSLSTIEDAQRLVCEHVKPGPIVRVPLREALGRVTAAPIVCDVDYPPFDKALMDGYAVRGIAGGPTFAVVGRAIAGRLTSRRLEPGDAMRINTGAAIPEGTETVVRIEDTAALNDGAAIMVMRDLAPGQNIDRRAQQVQAGSVVLAARTRLDPAGIGVAAAAGAAVVSVHAQPRVAILSTGDELIDASERPVGAQIRNSNGPMLSALIDASQARPVDLGTVRDDMVALVDHIREGLKNDLLCISGGMSMGTHDLVPAALAACEVHVVFRNVAIKPGKPTLFGTTDSGSHVFGLPGNPLSGYVAFRLLVEPAIELREGRSGILPTTYSARLIGHCKAVRDRQSYWPAIVRSGPHGELTAQRLSWQGSADLFGFHGANGLIVRRAQAPQVEDGASVDVILLKRL